MLNSIHNILPAYKQIYLLETKHSLINMFEINYGRETLLKYIFCFIFFILIYKLTNN